MFGLCERNVCEVWLRDELKKWSSHLLDNLSNCLITVHLKNFSCPQWDSKTDDLCDSGAVLLPTKLWRYEQVNLLGWCVPMKGMMSERKLTYSHLSGLITPLERELHWHRRDHGFESCRRHSCWDCPASVRIISSIHVWFIDMWLFCHRHSSWLQPSWQTACLWSLGKIWCRCTNQRPWRTNPNPYSWTSSSGYRRQYYLMLLYLSHSIWSCLENALSDISGVLQAYCNKYHIFIHAGSY